MAAPLQAQQLAVEPGLVDDPGISRRHHGVILGVHHQTGDIQLVALHIEVRRRHPRMGFHLADEMRPRLGRQAHVAGEAA
ncbi:hypothetical protein D3C81_1726030 [compost metagenome]